ncbi:F-box only protein 28 isoform X1 [Parasteatoda tepidariorum]|uniref:F-box only protein 28 isoform X1 n=1 Tax=Parasteatoda tepidariorum TaxID=114398 RepID=UPI00077F99A7|nr:F-box only protein 28 isoform X1 [Parasteatoda tepidariorum]
MSLLNLPDDVLEKVLSYISYDEVSRCRLVCRRINYVCKRVLNRGFHKVEKYHAQCLRHVKSQLPRRESERRKHPLARHCDILTAVETRLSLLGMTFLKYMEMNLCCFIPGKVLDEIYIVLRSVTSEQTPVRAHEVLQELRDLSSMAMEHFDEKISPAFRKRKETGPKIITGLNIFSRFRLLARIKCPVLLGLRSEGRTKNPFSSVSHHSKSSGRHCAGEHKVHKWREEAKSLVQKQNATNKEVQFLKQKVTEVNKTNSELEKKVNELQALVAAQVEKAKEQDLRLDFLSRLIDGGSMSPSNPSNQSKVKNNLTGMKSTLIKDNLRPHLRKKRQARVVTNQTDKPRKRLKRGE